MKRRGTYGRLGLLSLLGTLVLMLVPTAASADGQVLIRKIDTHQYPTVSVTVSINGLAPGDVGRIRLDENGRPIPIGSVRPLTEQGETVDVVLVVDTSRSMAGDPILQALDAAREFVRTSGPQIHIGVVTFAEKPKVALPITANRSRTLAALRTPETVLGTSLYDAVVLASSLFSGTGQRNIILLSDGADTRSKTDLAGASQAAKTANASVFTVGLSGKSADLETMRILAKDTGGTFSGATGSQLSALYQHLASQLSYQYEVTYRSRLPAGGQASVTVTAPGGTDTSLTTLPRLAPVVPGPIRPSEPLLHGQAGMLVALGLTFLAALAIASIGVGTVVGDRRRRVLARRMAVRSSSSETGLSFKNSSARPSSTFATCSMMS